MNVAIIKSKKVEKHNDIFLLHLGYKHYDLGVQIHSWGVRFITLTLVRVNTWISMVKM